MIDFIKITIFEKGLIDEVWNSHLLTFHSDQDRLCDDEIKTFRKKTYKGLTFILFADKLEIKGSLHKYFNNGIHNANDFSFQSCINVVWELAQTLNLDLKKCFVVNLEYGLNIIPPEPVKDVVVWLRYHERNEFRYFPELQYAKQAGHHSASGKINWYKVIKAYAKGLQLFEGKTYCNPNSFRFEVKSKRSKYLNRFGIYTLADLTTTVVYEKLANELLKEWNNVLLIDRTLPDTKELLKYRSIDFWEQCLNEYRNKFSTHKRKYFKLVNNYPDNQHKQIYLLLESKLNSFRNELRNSAISTPTEQIKKNKNGAYSTIVKIESAPIRICPVTGIDISIQKKNSFLLSNNGLRGLSKNQPEIYDLIKRRFLPRSGYSGKRTKYETDEINHISKQIRNAFYNPHPDIDTNNNQLTLPIF